MPVVDDPDLIVEMSHGEIAVMRFVGSADSAATRPLGLLLDQIHGELLERKTPELVLDLRALDHLGSPCLRELMAWLGRQQDAADDQRYRVRLRLLPNLGWQQSLQALACFDTSTITIET